jgi:molybdate transport system substrate-binding protein
MRHRLGLPLVLGLALAACSKKPAPSAEPPRVAAAADLTEAFTEIGAGFEKKTGVKPVLIFGSSGLLAKQLQEGAPFDLFAAASAAYADQVAWAGACDGATKRVYAQGRIVLWTKRGSSAGAPTSLADLRSPRFRHISIANPEHAPYGKAARQALEHAGVWADVKPRVVFGENVQQALQFAETGNADVAVVALSLANKATDGDVVLIDQALYAPLNQALIACKHGPNAAAGKQFADYASGPDGRAIMKKYGFGLPGEREAPQ